MKKITLIVVLILAPFVGQAQSFGNSLPKNEVNANILDAIVLGSIEVGYERFFGYHQSVGLDLFFNTRINYHSVNDSQDFNTGGIQLGYNYYFGQEKAASGFYANPLVRYRWGDFTETKKISGVPTKITTDLSSFLVGIGVGYKWNFGNNFIISPYATIGRNFSTEVKERFSQIEFTGGISVGYRF